MTTTKGCYGNKYISGVITCVGVHYLHNVEDNLERNVSEIFEAKIEESNYHKNQEYNEGVDEPGCKGRGYRCAILGTF